MQAVKANVTKGLIVGSRIPTCDNSGAKIIKITGVKNMKTVKGRISSAGIGDLVLAAVTSGRPDMRKQVVFAVIVRQKKEYRRHNGLRVEFEDNAAIMVNEKNEPVGSQVKGPMAKEVVERFLTLGKIASVVV